MPKRPTGAATWAAKAAAAIDQGQLETAKSCFAKAVALDSGNAQHRFNFAIVLEALGETGPAAEQLCEALRLAPDFADAARRLSWIIARHGLPGGKIRREGLEVALRHPTVDRDVLGTAALVYLSRREPWNDILSTGRTDGWQKAAQILCASL